MTLYFDSSALVKLVHAEPESAALTQFIADHPDELAATSELARTEVVRAVAGDGSVAAGDARRLLSRLAQLDVTTAILDAAADLPPSPPLRSLDAIHLASARTVGDLRAVVTYDRRMVDAAQALGLPVVTPV